MEENNEITELTLIEELISYTELERDELLTKLNIKIDDLCRQYKNLEDYMNYIRREDLNEYQMNIIYLYSLLSGIWSRRN